MSALFASSSGGSATDEEKNGGIVFAHGQEWSEQRRFTMKTLRDLGFGKTATDDVILDEVQKLVGLLAKGCANRQLLTHE